MLRITLSVALSMLVSVAYAQVGQIKSLEGTVHIVRRDTEIVATPGQKLEQMDTIVTGNDGQVGITFIDNTRFSAGPNTRLSLSRFRFNTTTHEGEFLTDLEQGTLSVISGQIAKHSPDQMKVKTPSSLLAVRGTNFLVKVD